MIPSSHTHSPAVLGWVIVNIPWSYTHCPSLILPHAQYPGQRQDGPTLMPLRPFPWSPWTVVVPPSMPILEPAITGVTWVFCAVFSADAVLKWTELSL